MCQLTASSHIKICLSSRPWNVFELAFGSMPKIYIHELTHNDVKDYTATRLQEHPKWGDICASSPGGGEWFVEEIANRCSGVFLWVFLVTNLLREGMTNQDRFPDLRRRLESVPRELGAFFQQILDSVEPLYHTKMATMLHIALVAKEPLDMVIYDFHDQEHDDEDYWQKQPILSFSKQEYDEIRDRMVSHLNCRTRGLLEAQYFKVNFLHRTVKDYLLEQPLSGMLKTKLPKYSGRKFNAELSILRAYTAWVRRATAEVLDRGSFAHYLGSNHKYLMDGVTPSLTEITRQLVPYAAKLDSQRLSDSSPDKTLDNMLDDMDSTYTTILSDARTKANTTNHFAWNTKLFFREHLAQGGVCNYILAKERKDPVCHLIPYGREYFQRCLKATMRRLQTKQRRLTGSGTLVSRVLVSRQKGGGGSYMPNPKPFAGEGSYMPNPKGKKRFASTVKPDLQAESSKKRRRSAGQTSTG